jgi:monoamine oxidase
MPYTAHAQVTTKDGTIHTAALVIVTVSLGVLKKGEITFTPALPSAKTKSINALGMGTLDKVVMVWDTPFWDNDMDMDWLLNVPSAGSSDMCAEWWVAASSGGIALVKAICADCWMNAQRGLAWPCICRRFVCVDCEAMPP